MEGCEGMAKEDSKKKKISDRWDKSVEEVGPA